MFFYKIQTNENGLILNGVYTDITFKKLEKIHQFHISPNQQKYFCEYFKDNINKEANFLFIEERDTLSKFLVEFLAKHSLVNTKEGEMLNVKQDFYDQYKEPKVLDSGRKHEIHPSGARRDSREDKGRFDLIGPNFLEGLAKVCEQGGIKYSDNNYLSGMKLNRYLDSACRHINNYRKGMRDEPHLFQAAWNLMAFIETENLIKKEKLPKELNDLFEY